MPQTHNSLFLSLSLVINLIACGDKNTDDNLDTDTVATEDMDNDGDGFTTAQGDCDDSNSDISPQASEICDEMDNDCDGLTDDEDGSLDRNTGSTFYADSDADGYGNPGYIMMSCAVQDGYVDNMDDCDDSNAEIAPNATEVCDGVDNDCDADIDDMDADLDASTGMAFYVDADGDGEGDANNTVMACSQPSGTSVSSTDCDDTDVGLNNADIDRDGVTTCGDVENYMRDCDDFNNTITLIDNDGDGYVSCIDDCDDDDYFTHAGIATNEADPTLCYRDYDGDGYGDNNPSNAEVTAGTDCYDWSEDLNPGDSDNDGVSSCDGDCDDYDSSVGIVDLDGDGFSGCYQDCWDSDVDADGDGILDSSVVYVGAASSEPDLCTVDADGDGYGDAFADASLGITSCFYLYLGDTGSLWDNASVRVSNEYGNSTYTVYSNGYAGYEVCGSGYVQLEYTCTSTYDCPNHSIFVFIDADGNGYDENDVVYSDGYLVDGATPQTGTFYSLSMAYVESGLDCDDSDTSSVGDDDNDGYTWCTYDCNDNDHFINPSATEIYYDGVDQNCDYASDFDADQDGVNIYALDCDGDGELETSCDLDGDGVDDFIGSLDCEDSVAYDYGDEDGDGFTWCTYDCDDSTTDADGDGVADGYFINPYQYDTPYDGIDQDCDPAYEFDVDGDGDNIDEVDCNGVMASSCDFDGDGVDDFTGGGDCDDNNASLESLDLDGDNYSTCPDSNGLVDCDDNDDATYPGAGFNEASFNATDYATYECLTDFDGDGYAYGQTNSCYIFAMRDTYGDGWNGNAILVYEDGVLTGIYTNDSSYGTSYQYEEVCLSNESSVVEFYFQDGDYNNEVRFSLYYADGGNGVLIANGQGAGTTSFIFDGIPYTNGAMFYTETLPLPYSYAIGGTDADDMDANVH